MSFPAQPERQRLTGFCRSRFLVKTSTLCQSAQALRLISQQEPQNRIWIDSWRNSALLQIPANKALVGLLIFPLRNLNRQGNCRLFHR